MAKPELPLKSGNEFDALTRWKRYMGWSSGIRAWVKRKYNKRVHKVMKQGWNKED